MRIWPLTCVVAAAVFAVAPQASADILQAAFTGTYIAGIGDYTSVPSGSPFSALFRFNSSSGSLSSAVGVETLAGNDPNSPFLGGSISLDNIVTASYGAGGNMSLSWLDSNFSI